MRHKTSLTLVSVVIPCYRQGKYLAESIRSVLASTWRPLEIIVVDDGSPELITEDVRELLCAENIRLIYQRNYGVSRARNVAIARANGEFILPLDADDTIEPTYIQKAVQVFRKNTKLAVVSSGYRTQREGKGKIEPFSCSKLLQHNQILVTSLFRKTTWTHVGGFSTILSRLALEDWDFWLSVYEYNPNFFILPEALVYYRQHASSRNGSTWSRRISKLLILLRHWKLYLKHPRDLFFSLGARWFIS